MSHIRIEGSGLLLMVIISLVIGGIVVVVFSSTTDPMEKILGEEQVLNVLFILEKESAEQVLSSYVIMYYPPTRKAAIIDIPPETGLIIKSLNRVDSIDVLYKRRNVEPFTKEVADLLGISLHFTLVFSQDRLVKLVDLMDGLSVFIPQEVEYEEGGKKKIALPAGRLTLDGTKTLQYINYRIPEEEVESQEQRSSKIFLALLRRLQERLDFIQQPEVWRVSKTCFITPLPDEDLQRLLQEVLRLDTERVIMHRISGLYREVSGKRLLFPSYEGELIREVVRQNVSLLVRQQEGNIPDRVFTLEILNGTPLSGLARKTGELMKGFGYDVISTGNAERNDYERTLIIDRTNYPDMTKQLAGLLRCTNIVQERLAPNKEENTELSLETYRADYTIILGRDFNGRYVVR
ncbi:MAG: LCP family protein [Treponemataceae bacterium]|nr:LCP family protein [Treponemataceae bacterium]